MTSATLTNSNTGTQVRTETATDVVGKGTITVMAGLSVLIGLWAVAAFAGGLLASGGPIAMIQSWFGAVIG